MNTRLQTLIASGLLILTACSTLHPTPALSAAGPNIMVFGDDADRDTVPRNTRVFNRVIHALRSQLNDRGFDVYDETAVTGKDSIDGNAGYVQGRTRRTDVEILDIAQSLRRPPIDVAVIFQIYASAQSKGYITKVRTRIAGHMLATQSGKYLGDFEVKKLYTAPAACNRECILEVVGARSRDLAQDLGDALAVKLAHLSGDAGQGLSEPPAEPGMARDYVLIFNNFSDDERLDIEEYLVIFSGYEHYRPVDCSRRRCEYQYKGRISSAKLHRNIKRMLEQLAIKANVQYEGNMIRVDRITLRHERRRTPSGSGW
jgi:hypothetical protein